MVTDFITIGRCGSWYNWTFTHPHVASIEQQLCLIYVEDTTVHLRQGNQISVAVKHGESVLQERFPKAHEPRMEVVIRGPEHLPLLDSRCNCHVERNSGLVQHQLNHGVLYVVTQGDAANLVYHHQQLLPHNTSQLSCFI